MKTIHDLIGEHSFFKEIGDDHIATIAGCGSNVHFKSGDLLAKEGNSADNFYIIRKGRVNIEIQASSEKNLIIQTLEEGQVVGWSWIFPPYRWSFNIKAMSDVSAVALDGRCLRDKCEHDPALGYSLMKQFAKIMSERLVSTRVQLLDMYGKANYD